MFKCSLLVYTNRLSDLITFKKTLTSPKQKDEKMQLHHISEITSQRFF